MKIGYIYDNRDIITDASNPVDFIVIGIVDGYTICKVIKQSK